MTHWPIILIALATGFAVASIRADLAQLVRKHFKGKE